MLVKSVTRVGKSRSYCQLEFFFNKTLAGLQLLAILNNIQSVYSVIARCPRAGTDCKDV